MKTSLKLVVGLASLLVFLGAQPSQAQSVPKAAEIKEFLAGKTVRWSPEAAWEFWPNGAFIRILDPPHHNFNSGYYEVSDGQVCGRLYDTHGLLLERQTRVDPRPHCYKIIKVGGQYYDISAGGVKTLMLPK
jgi:hypothetical protein